MRDGALTRDLHDVVAHNATVAGIHALAARRLLTSDPERAADSLAIVGAAAHEMSADLRRIHGLLDDGSEVAHRPSPHLGGVAELVERARDGGAELEFELDGAHWSVAPGLQVTAFRLLELLLAEPASAPARLAIRCDAGLTIGLDYAGGEASVPAAVRDRVRLLGGHTIQQAPGSVSLQWRDDEAGSTSDGRVTTSSVTEDETRPGAS
jgi:hypothetical protein